MQPIYLDEIAHLIVSERLGTVELLEKNGISGASSMDDESLFREIMKNNSNSEIKSGLLKMLSRNPLNRHCAHCFDHAKGAFEVAKKIYKEIHS